jgi:hypothetical protein
MKNLKLLHTAVTLLIFASPVLAGIDDGLVASYPFNGSADEATGAGPDGTVFGATLTEDRYGKADSAYHFDGVNDYINIGNTLNFPAWDTYSVSVWFLNDGGGDLSDGYGQKIIDKTTWYSDFYLSVASHSSGFLVWKTYQGGSGDIAQFSDYRDSTWHHIVINKNGTSGELWVDGQLVGTSGVIKTVTNSQPVLFGYSFSGDGFQRKYWSGKIDDIRIYNRTLTDVEIGELFNGFHPIRLEAEDMQLDTYRIEALDFASGGALINLKGPGFVGSAKLPFPGATGEYDIVVVYHDENDGLAQLSVSINDREVDSWMLDERVKGGEQPIEANRFTRQVATGYTVNNGDEIAIYGLQGNWDHANVDYIEFVYRQQSPPSGRIEAEDMLLDGYRIEALDFASGGALINLKGPAANGSATLAFPGNTGQYNIYVVYHDENDGVAQLTVSIAGVSVDSWILDERIKGGEQPQEFNRFTRQVATDYTVSNGDEIRIEGLQGNWDNANVDYIEFVLTQPLPPSGRIEAEDMRLEGYTIETLDFASGGALINLKGPASNGSAMLSFPGIRQLYDIIVVYHDENDGMAQLSVSIDGVSVDSWVLDQRIPDGQQPEEFNRFTRQIATEYLIRRGAEIRIDGLQGNWDHANVDYIEFLGKGT